MAELGDCSGIEWHEAESDCGALQVEADAPPERREESHCDPPVPHGAGARNAGQGDPEGDGRVDGSRAQAALEARPQEVRREGE